MNAKSIDSLIVQLLGGRDTLDFEASSDCEIHTLVSHDHLPLYVLMLTTLSRHWTSAQVVVHDDGSLTDTDVDRLRNLVPAARTIRRGESDALINKRLADLPLVRKVRESNPRLIQLVDYYVLSDSRFIVGCDADVVFLERPTEVIEWSDGKRSGVDFMYSPERGWRPKGVHWIPEYFPGRPYITDLCCGFVAARAEAFRTEDLEAAMAGAPEELLFRGRFVTQMFYSLLAGQLPIQRIWSLGEAYRSAPHRWLPRFERVICHYFASHEQRSVDQIAHDERAVLASLAPARMTRGDAVRVLAEYMHE